jgi:hypothetical protein
MIMNEGVGGCDVRESDCHVVENSIPMLNGRTEESHDIRIGITCIRTSGIPMQVGRIAAL